MYTTPQVRELGSFAELTLSSITKYTGGTDTVTYVNSQGQVESTTTIPGHGASVS